MSKLTIRLSPQLSVISRTIHQLGWQRASAYVLKERILRLTSRSARDSTSYRTYRLSVPGNPIPLVCRLRSSDRYAFAQVFIHEQYACPEPTVPPKYIVDCGANVGYASVYLLRKFPDAKVVAIEPDLRNYKILAENLAPYGARAVPMLAAVWSYEVDLSLRLNSANRGAEWGTQVQESTTGETPDVAAVDIVWLLNRSPHGRIDILKIDIEGAEEMVFAQGYRQWIHHVGIIMIELHSERSRTLFFKALESGKFMVSQRGEITIAQSVAQ